MSFGEKKRDGEMEAGNWKKAAEDLFLVYSFLKG